MLLDDNGLKIGKFDPLIAAAFGNTPGEEGSQLTSECQKHGRMKVQVRDVLYCLIRSPGTEFSKSLVQNSGQDANAIIGVLESGAEDVEDGDMIPLQLDTSVVAPDVVALFESAEAKLVERQQQRVDDSIITGAVLATLSHELRTMLQAFLGEDGYTTLTRRIEDPNPEGRILITDDGEFQRNVLGKSALALLTRMVEDAASMGSKRIGAKNLLYTLLGEEAGLITRSLTLFGLDVKNQLQAPLTRQLTKPGKKRNSELTLHRACMMETVARLLEHAQKLANRRDGVLLEHDISVSFMERQDRELSQLLSGIEGIEVHQLKEVVLDAEPDLDDDDEADFTQVPLSEIEQNMKAAICGQGQAVDRIMPWIKRLRFGLPRDGRPAGVFLFLGPTGTGKTQLAKELARYVYGDPEQMIFLEMGQFKSKESMNMFIGAPPGYVGYGEGKLTNGLAEKPECVVLFDEIEKADTQVFDTLLRFADEGLISDPAGPVRDGRKCLIVMTTNAGQAWLREHLQENPEAVNDPATLSEELFEAAMRQMAEAGFRPEFLGRVDERVTYLPFTLEACEQIVDLVLDKEIAKLLDLKGITLEVDPAAKRDLAEFAHARSLDEGARGAPRAVNEMIITPAIDLLSDLVEQQGDLRGTKVIASKVGEDQVPALEIVK